MLKIYPDLVWTQGYEKILRRGDNMLHRYRKAFVKQNQNRLYCLQSM
jgi:hypothetical protein